MDFSQRLAGFESELSLPLLSISDSCVVSLKPSTSSTSEFFWFTRLVEGQLLSAHTGLLDMLGRDSESACTWALLDFDSQGPRKLRGMEAFSEFFSKSTCGNFALYSKDTWRLFSSLKEAKVAAGSAGPFLLVALPVSPQRIYRVPWRKGQLPTVSTPRSECSSPRKSTRFQHTKMLKKSSFSPLLPYHSPQSGHASFERLADLAQSCLDCVSVDSMTLHVLEDSNGRQWLLNATNVSYTDKEQQFLPRLTSRSEEVKDTTRFNLSSSAKSLFSKTLQRPPYIDMSEVHRKNVDFYRRNLLKMPFNPSSCSLPTSPASQSLARISGKLDQCRFSCIAEEAELLTFSSVALQEIIRKMYEKFQGDEVLGRYFACKHLQHLSTHFYRAIVQPKNYSLSVKVKAVHQGLCISPDTFAIFATGFQEAMREANIPEEVANLIKERVTSYESEVVSK